MDGWQQCFSLAYCSEAKEIIVSLSLRFVVVDHYFASLSFVSFRLHFFFLLGRDAFVRGLGSRTDAYETFS
jgi:hypothetical protein